MINSVLDRGSLSSEFLLLTAVFVSIDCSGMFRAPQHRRLQYTLGTSFQSYLHDVRFDMPFIRMTAQKGVFSACVRKAGQCIKQFSELSKPAQAGSLLSACS